MAQTVLSFSLYLQYITMATYNYFYTYSAHISQTIQSNPEVVLK